MKLRGPQMVKEGMGGCLRLQGASWSCKGPQRENRDYWALFGDPPTSDRLPTRLTRLSLGAPRAWGPQRLRGLQGLGAPMAWGPQSWGVPKARQLRILGVG